MPSPINNILPFATGVGANVLSQAAYVADSQRTIGHQPGEARAELENSVLAQVSTVASGLAEFMVAFGTSDVVADGDQVAFKNKLAAALAGWLDSLSRWAPGDLKCSVQPFSQSGWLICDGSLVSRTTYAKLFQAIGTTYGAGDGSTTFQLPDFRGVFMRGWDNGRGLDPGRVIGSYQEDQVEKHKHVMGWGEADAGAGEFGSTAEAGHPGSNATDTDNHYYYTNDGSDYGGNVVNTSGLIGNETRPKNVAVNILIKT